MPALSDFSPSALKNGLKSALRVIRLPIPRYRNMDWPVATVLLGTLATLGVGILKWMPRRNAPRREALDNGRVYARATDMAEIRARLVSLEQAHHVLRAEIRADIKELQSTIREVLSQKKLIVRGPWSVAKDNDRWTTDN